MATLRWLWRQLTSMRIALILLFLLALASIPGSIFPQRGTSPLRVNEFLQDNPTSGPILDRFYMFDVLHRFQKQRVDNMKISCCVFKACLITCKNREIIMYTLLCLCRKSAEKKKHSQRKVYIIETMVTFSI